MSVAIITGSTGLVGSEAVNFFHDKGFDVVGIDNNLRKYYIIAKKMMHQLIKIKNL